MRFLCVSDVHGHLDRLRAVLDFANGLGWDKLVCCGDVCFPGPEPLAVWKLLLEHQALVVQGLGDRALATIDPDKLVATAAEQQARVQRLRDTHRQLGDLIIARLAKLPPIARLPVENGATMTVVHGSPADPWEPITQDLSDDEISALLGDDCGDIVVCGGDHTAFERRIGEVQVVAVGSVGEAPDGTHAHAAIVETAQVGLEVRPIAVPLGD